MSEKENIDPRESEVAPVADADLEEVVGGAGEEVVDFAAEQLGITRT